MMNRAQPASLIATVLVLACNTDKTPAAGEDTAFTELESAEAQVTDVSARLDDDFASLVYVSWEQTADGSVWVEFSFDEGEWHSSPPVETAAGPQEHLLLGVPYEAEVTYRVVSDFGDGPLTAEEASITAGSLSVAPAAAMLHTADSSAWEDSGRFLLTSLWNLVVIIDRQGRVVWALETPYQRSTLFARPSMDGDDLLIDFNSFWEAFDDGASGQVVRMKIDGTIEETYDTPGLNHPFTDLPDGSIVWGAADGTYLEETLEKLHPDGTRETLWSCADFLAAEGVTDDNYCGSNTIWWDEYADTFLFSFYSFHSVIEVDHATGETLRYFGHVADGAWAFDSDDTAFWHQHGPHITDDGTLLLSAKNTRGGDETVVREYAMDDETETLVEVWSFGEGEGIYGSEGGEAHRLANGNTLHNYGMGKRIREITPDGAVVWDVELAWAGWLGKSVFLEDLYAFAP